MIEAKFQVGQSVSQLETQLKEERNKALGDTSHYDGWKIGDFIQDLKLDFFEGNIIKYVCRHRKKNGRIDLLKARTYLDKLISFNYKD